MPSRAVAIRRHGLQLSSSVVRRGGICSAAHESPAIQCWPELSTTVILSDTTRPQERSKVEESRQCFLCHAASGSSNEEPISPLGLAGTRRDFSSYPNRFICANPRKSAAKKFLIRVDSRLSRAHKSLPQPAQTIHFLNLPRLFQPV